MSISVFPRRISRGLITGVVFGLGFCWCVAGGAQAVAGPRLAGPIAAAGDEGNSRSGVAASLLPDAPGVVEYSSSSAAAEGNVLPMFALDAHAQDTKSVSAPAPAEASRRQNFIQAGQTAPALTPGDKVLLGVKGSFSLVAMAGWFTSAGYDQWLNGSPNYGTDRGAFGERLGAAALCNSSEDILSESVMAPLLREDPRYYRMGPGHNFFLRVVYAGTRPVITRTDGGRTTPNLALILGNAEGSALTNAYYPQVNRGMTQTMETLGLSIGGSAIGDVMGEFYGDVMRMFHKQQ